MKGKVFLLSFPILNASDHYPCDSLFMNSTISVYFAGYQLSASSFLGVLANSAVQSPPYRKFLRSFSLQNGLLFSVAQSAREALCSPCSFCFLGIAFGENLPYVCKQ